MQQIIKNSILVLLFTLILTGVSAQSNETKKIIINKWIIDKEAMEKVLVDNPQIAGLDEVNKQIIITRSLQKISSMTKEFKEDGTCISISSKGTTIGKWSLSSDGKELIIKSTDKPEKKFTVVSVSKTKLHLIIEGYDLFMISEN